MRIFRLVSRGNHPLNRFLKAIISYKNAYQRISADKRRGNIAQEDWRRAKAEIKDLKDMAIAGRFTDREREEKRPAETLYASLNIVRRGGR